MELIFDIETTGLDPKNDEILQFSAINEKEEVLFNMYFRPCHIKQWPEAEQVHHISPKDVEDKMHIDKYINDIQMLFDMADCIISYNGKFDMDFLKEAGIKFDKNKPHYDVMKLFAPIYGADTTTEDTWDPYRKHYKWKKLKDAAKYFGYEFNAHDSLEDVKATLFVHKKIQELYKSGKYVPTKARKPEEKKEETSGQLMLDIEMPASLCLAKNYAYLCTNESDGDDEQMEKLMYADNINGGWYKDVISSVNDPLPKYEQLLADCQQGDTIYIEKMSRLAKSYQQLSNKLHNLVDEKKVTVKFIDENLTIKEGSLILPMIDNFAKFSNDIAVESRKKGYRKAVSEGRVGRKKIEVDEALFKDCYIKYLRKEIDVKTFSQMINVSTTTCRKLIKEYA